MTIWDSLAGRKSASTNTPASSVSQTTDTQTDSFQADSFQPAAFRPSAATNVSSLINQSGTFDAAQLHPLAGLDKGTLDYLTLEEGALSQLPGARSALPSRGWSDDLCYGTGTTYLTALTLGGAWGLSEGLSKTATTTTMMQMPPRLRLNAVLNSVTRRGPFLGNSAGIVAMVYNIFNSTIGYYRGKHDTTNGIVAGALSGALFKSTRGLRPMAISSGLVAGAAATWAIIRKVVFQ